MPQEKSGEQYVRKLRELLFVLGYEAAELSNERKRGKGNEDNGTRVATWTFF